MVGEEVHDELRHLIISQSVRHPTPVVQSEWDIGDISQEIAGIDHDNILALAHTTDLTWVADYTLQINFSLKKKHDCMHFKYKCEGWGLSVICAV